MGGLANFAATKMVDKQHFPGPGSYQPKLDSGRSVSISNRNGGAAGASESRRAAAGEIGPGKYDIKSLIGEGPKYSFSPRLHSDEASPAGGSPRRSSAGKGGAAGSSGGEIPKQYSMALTPSSPRCSLHGRTRASGTAGSSAAVPGPGHYATASTLDKRGITLSSRFDTMRSSEAADVPGPGQYTVPRFGDKVPLPKPPHIPHASPRVDDRPGPGAYEVHGTIAERVSPRQRISSDALFGARVHPPEGCSVAPGPGTYLPENGTFTEQLRHGKGVSMGSRNNPSGELESIYPKPGPCEYNIPGTFEYDGKKGFSLHSRREEPAPKLKVPGPGQYHPGGSVAETIMQSHQGTRFNGGKPFQKGTEPKAPKIDGMPGPGAYAPDRSLISPRVKGFAFNSRGSGKHDNPFVDWAVAPGPGTYNPKEIHTQTAAPGFTFYKGQF
jgi:hypothetical protein